MGIDMLDKSISKANFKEMAFIFIYLKALNIEANLEMIDLTAKASYTWLINNKWGPDKFWYMMESGWRVWDMVKEYIIITRIKITMIEVIFMKEDGIKMKKQKGFIIGHMNLMQKKRTISWMGMENIILIKQKHNISEILDKTNL